jgi:large conductance mechanosensitive channel
MTGFKNFIMRGNLVELAAAVLIGTQFSNLVKQLISWFINPLLSLVGGTSNFGNLVFNARRASWSRPGAHGPDHARHRTVQPIG